MNTLFISEPLSQGQISVPFRPCKCSISLVSLSVQNLAPREKHFFDISIKCEQIDSNMLNRKRILQKIRFNPKEDFHTFHFPSPVFFPLDSSDQHLSFQFFLDDKKILSTTKDIVMFINIRPHDGPAGTWVKYV